MCSCSGPFGVTAQPVADVVQAWAKSTNAAGGIAGHPVHIKFYDDANNPGTSVTDIQSLISAHVDVIVDGSNLDSTWVDKVEAAKIPVVGAQSNTEPFTTSAYFFPSGQTIDSINYAVVATAKASGAHSLGLLYCAEAPQCQQGVSVIRGNAAKQHISEVYNGSISATAPNYTAQCVAARQAKVDGLIVLHTPPVAARVGADCTTQGYHPTYITEGNGFSEQEGTAPGFKDNLWSPYPILPYWVDKPPVQVMNQAVDKYYPGLRHKTEAWSQAAAQGWTAGLLVREAVKASGLTANAAPSAAAILKGLNSLHNDTLDGWSPPLTFTPGRTHRVDCWFTGRVHNGARSLVDDGKLTCITGGS